MNRRSFLNRVAGVLGAVCAVPFVGRRWWGTRYLGPAIPGTSFMGVATRGELPGVKVFFDDYGHTLTSNDVSVTTNYTISYYPEGSPELKVSL